MCYNLFVRITINTNRGIDIEIEYNQEQDINEYSRTITAIELLTDKLKNEMVESLSGEILINTEDDTTTQVKTAKRQDKTIKIKFQ